MSDKTKAILASMAHDSIMLDDADDIQAVVEALRKLALDSTLPLRARQFFAALVNDVNVSF